MASLDRLPNQPTSHSLGANIGANLQTDQASADLCVAQAHAERPRAEAVAQEQLMHALVEENHAKVVLAEAHIPLAMTQAFRDGSLGVKDYFNIQADTEMRNSTATIAGRNEPNDRPMG
jgi:uncharacterized protein YqfA (UPF0365 family)